MAEKITPEVVYLEMTQPQANPRFGKMAEGDIKPFDAETAERYLRAGVAKQSTESAYNKHREKKLEVGDKRAAAIQDMNQRRSAYWDISYRDAVTADPERLREAMEAGIRPINVGNLVDDDGMPLPLDASLEDILAARENLQHPDADASFAHTQASTSGGGSHYYTPIPEKQVDMAPEPLKPAMIRTDEPRKRVTGVRRSQVGNAAESEGKAKPGTTVGDSLGNVRTED